VEIQFAGLSEAKLILAAPPADTRAEQRDVCTLLDAVVKTAGVLSLPFGFASDMAPQELERCPAVLGHAARDLASDDRPLLPARRSATTAAWLPTRSTGWARPVSDNRVVFDTPLAMLRTASGDSPSPWTAAARISIFPDALPSKAVI
jgi:hypothetical protein